MVRRATTAYNAATSAMSNGWSGTINRPPTLQVMATPGKLRAVYRNVLDSLGGPSPTARAHISRFDADGAVVFFSFDGARLRDAERVAESAGGWLLGARAHKLDAYLRALREDLDPGHIMNPGALLGTV